ncbi:MAG: GAF domain-containing sensor histidine kinase [Thermoflexales bacterium]|nr:GAF domain-containing sensor histidine kinase [Thermoflexales bacterium]
MSDPITQALASELARSREEAAALSRVSLDLARATDMNAVVSSSLGHALSLVQGQFGQVLLREGNKLVVRYTTNVPPSDLGLAPAVDDCVSGLAVLERKSVIVPDVDKVDYAVVEWIETPSGRQGQLLHRSTEKPCYQRVLEAEKARMQAEMVVPLVLGDEVIGVLNVESPLLDSFTLDQARILESLAGQVAVAIDRARRFELQTLAEVGGLSGDIVHRLNNPVGAISARLELLKKKDFYAQLVTGQPYFGQFVERTERDINAIKSIIQELRSVIKGQRPGAAELQAAIQAALSKAALPGNIQVELALPPQPIHVIANQRLVNVFWNLFDNARKAMPGGGRLSVTADAPAGDEWIGVEVRDTGGGIEPWRLEAIFDPGETSTQEPHAPVHGLGLWWTKAQLESFGAAIGVESELGTGTCVTLKLRKA